MHHHLIKVTITLVFACCSSFADAYKSPRWYAPELLDDTAKSLQQIDSSSASQNDYCRNVYKKLYADNSLDIAVFYGFTELSESGIVIDPYSLHDLLRYIQQPCNEHLYACGFTLQKPVTDGFYQLRKTIDFEQKPVDISLRLYDSSVSDRYEIAINPMLEQQQKKSQQVYQQFLQSLKQDDVIFYVGHARQGTGPGFSPFETFSSNWWNAILPGSPIDDMTRTLKARQQPAKMIGLFACQTEQYYADKLASVSPETALIVSDNDTYSDTDNINLLGALNAILAKHCKSEFEQSISVQSGSAHYHLQHFFDKRSVDPI